MKGYKLKGIPFKGGAFNISMIFFNFLKLEF